MPAGHTPQSGPLVVHLREGMSSHLVSVYAGARLNTYIGLITYPAQNGETVHSQRKLFPGEAVNTYQGAGSDPP